MTRLRQYKYAWDSSADPLASGAMREVVLQGAETEDLREGSTAVCTFVGNSEPVGYSMACHIQLDAIKVQITNPTNAAMNFSEGFLVVTVAPPPGVFAAGLVAEPGTDYGPPSGGGGGGTVDSVTGGTGVDVDATDPANPIANLDTATLASLAKADSALQAAVLSVVAGTNVTVDATDPAHPIVNSSGGGGGAAFSGARAHNSTNQGPFGAGTAQLAFDVEEFDTDAYFDIGGGVEFIIPVGGTGIYLVGADVEGSGTASLPRLIIKVDGTQVFRSDPHSADDASIGGSVLLSLAAGASVTCHIQADDNCTSIAGAGTPAFWITKLGTLP